MEDKLRPVVKGEGTTRSERILGKLGAASFLNLWTYPSPHRNKKQHGKGDGKEICDLLVVCGDDVIVFSDKEIGWSECKPLPVAWGRWYREAVQESVKQIRGAESHLRRNLSDVYLDKECTVPLPIALPPPDRMRMYGVVIATGAEAACRKITGNRQGRLRIDGRLKGRTHFDPAIRPENAFTIGDPDPAGSFVHVFDRPGMVAVLTMMDTVTDFVRYLRKRQQALRDGIVISATGEDDLVAYYMWDIGDDGDHDFLRQDGKRGYVVEDGTAGLLKASSQFQSRIANDRVSYVWDRLIDTVTGHLLARTDIVVVGERLSISEAEEGLRHMALEPRFNRRSLATRVMDAMSGIVRERADRNAAILLPQPGDERQVGYVALVVANRDRNFDGEEMYRKVRLGLAAVYARALLANNRHLDAVVAIGLDAPQELTGKRGGSQDVAVHYQVEWTDEILAEVRSQQEEFRILVGYGGGGRRMRAAEYGGEESRQQRRARERRMKKNQHRT